MDSLSHASGTGCARSARRALAIMLVALATGVAAGAAEGGTPAPAGPLVFTAPSQHFHPPLAAQQVEANFAFTNVGSTAVGILGTSTSCGCTTATLSKAVFNPGESGTITATFVIGDRTGQQSKSVHVKTDSPRQPAIDLMIHVDLPDGPLVSPVISYWRIGAAPTPRTISAVLPPGSPFRFTTAALTAQAATAFTLEAHLSADGGTVDMRVVPLRTTQGLGAAIDLQAVAIADPAVRHTFRAFMCITDPLPASADPLPDPAPPRP